jgi:hypothetical protein
MTCDGAAPSAHSGCRLLVRGAGEPGGEERGGWPFVAYVVVHAHRAQRVGEHAVYLVYLGLGGVLGRAE